MGKVLSLLYGIICYVVFLASFLYAIGFVGNLIVPKTINMGVETDFIEALLINLGLLSLFAIQHTIMARPKFKQAWTKIIPKQVERSTFVLFASLLLFLLYWQWRPMTDPVWVVENPIWVSIIMAVFVLGWLMVLLSTFMIDHFDLFGLRQVWLHMTNKEHTQLHFKTVGLYKFIRHPIMLGFMIAFWAIPSMNVGSLLFAVVTTAYMSLGVIIEERDLIAAMGPEYEDYRRRVPKFIPFSKRQPAKTVGS